MALLSVNLMSSVLKRPVTLNAVLPSDRMSGPSDRPLRMMILLHGALGNYSDWVTNTRIQILAEEKGICVIMPSGENSFYLDNPLSSNFFGTYVWEELPEIDWVAMGRYLFLARFDTIEEVREFIAAATG